MKQVSLYVHLPFCLRKCLFCSFAVSIGQEHRRDEYIEALIKEMSAYQGLHISSVYLGGGTPSMMEEAQLTLLFKALRDRMSLEEDCEISLEANPEDISSAKLEVLRAQGINRLSIGVQSFNDRYLKFLGRAHTSVRATEAISRAREAGFSNISGDLMYGFPGQTRDELAQDIDRMIATGVGHISIYTLTIEANSRFYAQALKLDDDEKLADHYCFIIARLKEAGFEQYEVSNFARKGRMSAHNRHYWLGGEYIGLGMGAHGYWQGVRYWNEDRLNAYLKRMETFLQARQGEETLSKETQIKERLIFGLRMNEGIDDETLFKEAASALKERLTSEIEALIKEGFLKRDGVFLKVTDKGRMVLDEIAVKLV